MSDIEQIFKELIDDLVPRLEAAESQATMMLQLLKDKRIVSDDELAPYLQQAANASSVKGQAARLRFQHLADSAIKRIQQAAQETAIKVLEESREQEKEGGASTQTNRQEKDKEQQAETSQAPPKETNSSEHAVGDKGEQEKSAPGDKGEKATPASDTSSRKNAA